MKSKKFLLSLFCILISGIIIGCSATQPKQKSNLTFSVVKSNIKKGETNQAKILQVLGSPNITTRHSDGNEVWTYSRQSFDTESGGYAGGLIVFGGYKAFKSSAYSSFDLIVTFDQKDIVKEYTVVASQF